MGAKERKRQKLKHSKKNLQFRLSDGRSDGQDKKSETLVDYTCEQDILVVGDGDFSYSVGLVKHNLNGDGRHFVATSYDTEADLKDKYSNAETACKFLRHARVNVLHGIDATNLKTTLGKFAGDKYDRIIFNFPHSGQQRVHTNRILLRNFFRSSAEFVNQNGGQVHLTMKMKPPYTNWLPLEQADAAGFKFVCSVPFTGPAGYQHRTTDPTAQQIDAKWCKTLIFSPPSPDKIKALSKHDNDDGGDDDDDDDVILFDTDIRMNVNAPISDIDDTNSSHDFNNGKHGKKTKRKRDQIIENTSQNGRRVGSDENDDEQDDVWKSANIKQQQLFHQEQRQKIGPLKSLKSKDKQQLQHSKNKTNSGTVQQPLQNLQKKKEKQQKQKEQRQKQQQQPAVAQFQNPSQAQQHQPKQIQVAKEQKQVWSIKEQRYIIT